MFEHKCVFKFKPTEGVDLEEMELEMIDFGVDEFYAEEGEVTVYAAYESFGQIQTWIEGKGYELVSGEAVRIPTDTKELTPEEREAVNKLIEHLEEDDDVTNVYTTMAESEEEDEE
jgi:transcriptional/translational regulatory protein YebC/TACO1